MEKKVVVHNKVFAVSITAQEIAERVCVLGSKISADMKGKNPLFVCVLNGAFMFASDLLKCIDVPCEVSFVKLSSYQGTGSSGNVRQLIGLGENLTGRSVVVIEDIVDTGLTMERIIATLKEAGANEVKVASFLYKPDAFKASFSIDYLGFKIPNKFVVGYGLDYDGIGRNFPEVYKLVEN